MLIDAFDTGIYLQVAHNLTAHGTFASSLTGESNFMAHHFQPVVALLTAPLALAYRPLTLLVLDALAVAVTVVILLRKNSAVGLPVVTSTIVLAMLFHPAIAGRIDHSFSPDALALPAFAWMASSLEGGPSQSRIGSWMIAIVWAGICKETFWIINGAVLLAVFLRTRRLGWLVGSAACAVIFTLLFGWWMPAHTDLPAYYGLSYYFTPEESQSLGSVLRALLGNVFSSRSLVSCLTLVWMTLALGFIRPRWTWIPAGVALGFVVIARSDLVHHPANHYLLPVLPFLAVAAMHNAKTLARRASRWRIDHKYGMFMALMPLAYTLFFSGGIIYSLATISGTPKRAFLRQDIADFSKKFLSNETSLIVDSSLQPALFNHQDLTVLLNFSGNPRLLNSHELNAAHTLLTTVELKKLDDCHAVQVGGDELHVNYDFFIKLCERVKSDGELLGVWEQSGLVGYRLALRPAGS